MDKNKEGTLLQRRRKSVKISKEETLLILRAYMNHPTSWQEIMEEVKQNLDVLLPSAREVYTTGSLRQLRDRMSGKLSSLIKKRPEDITDADVRSAVEDIRRLERRLIPEPEPAQEPEELHQEEQAEEAEPARPQPDVRAEMAAAVSTDASDAEQHQRRKTPERRRRQRKRPLAELIRANQEAI